MPKKHFVEKSINRLVGRAIHQFNLLEHGDRIMVAVSGGADSLVMLHFLMEWQKKAPISFEIFPVYLDMGFDKLNTLQTLQNHFKELSLPFYIEQTDIGSWSHGPSNRNKSPCFLCSWRRRKRLFELTQVMGCNKIALGHNLDDMIETFLMNIFYSGETSTMLPRQSMFKGLITLIRPLIRVEKKDIEKQLKKEKLYQKILGNKLKKPTEDEMKAYYQKHKKEFTIPGKIKIQEYLSNDPRALQAIKMQPMLMLQNVKITPRTIDPKKTNPQLLQLILQTPVKEFTPIVNLGKNQAAMFFVQSKGKSVTAPYEQVKQNIFMRMMKDQEQANLIAYFEKKKSEANIKVLRKP